MVACPLGRESRGLVYIHTVLYAATTHVTLPTHRMASNLAHGPWQIIYCLNLPCRNLAARHGRPGLGSSCTSCTCSTRHYWWQFGGSSTATVCVALPRTHPRSKDRVALQSVTVQAPTKAVL